LATTIFITGAGGFVGRALVRAGEQAGARIVPLARDRAAEQVRRSGSDEDTLLHLAWPDLRSTSSGASGPADDGKSWPAFVDWSTGLRQACAETGVRFVGIGSGVEAYLEPGSGLGEPYLGYGRRKTELRMALGVVGEVSWVRLHFLFGPYEAAHRIVPSAIRAALKGTEFACGDRDRRRCWLHVDDMAAALCGFAAEPRPGIWDIAGRKPISFDELFALVEAAVGRPLRLAAGERSTADGRLKLIEPTNLAPNLLNSAGLPTNLQDRLAGYAQWIRGQSA
jgi:nucleoside-diphosphate-sugar epimerase